MVADGDQPRGRSSGSSVQKDDEHVPRLDFSRYAAVLRSPGAPWFTLAGWLGRYPRAALGFAIILVVVARTGSYALAGLISALNVVGVSIGGPLWSRAMDRRGQRNIMVLSSGLLCVGVAAFAATLALDAPSVWAVAAFVVGLASVDVSASVRARWSGLLPGHGRETAFAVEGIADESVFAIAPPLVSLIAVALDPLAGIVAIVGVGVLGAVSLALQRGSEPPLHPSTSRVGRVPPAGVIAVSVAFAGVGAMFGSFDVTAVAWADAAHAPLAAGGLMAALAVGNTIGAVLFGALHWRVSPRRRWLGLATALAIVGWALPLSAGGWWVLAATVLVGVAIGPTLVAGYTLVETRATTGRVTELLAYPALGLGAGVPLGSTLAGCRSMRRELCSGSS